MHITFTVILLEFLLDSYFYFSVVYFSYNFLRVTEYVNLFSCLKSLLLEYIRGQSQSLVSQTLPVEKVETLLTCISFTISHSCLWSPTRQFYDKYSWIVSYNLGWMWALIAPEITDRVQEIIQRFRKNSRWCCKVCVSVFMFLAIMMIILHQPPLGERSNINHAFFY